MGDQPRRKRTGTQTNSSFPASKAHLLRRSLLTGFVIGIGGTISFIVWTLPYIIPLLARDTKLFTYLLVFSPTLFTMLALLLVLILWWAGIDRGWWRGITFLQRASVSTWDKANTKMRGNPTTRETNISSRRLHTRHTSAAELQQRRRKRLYEGRTYRGKIRHLDIKRVSSSLLESAVPSTRSDSEESASSPKIEPGTGRTTTRDVEERKGTQTSRPATNTPTTDDLVTPFPSNMESSPSLYSTTQIPLIQQPVSIYLLKEFRVLIQNAEGIQRPVHLRRKRREDNKYTERELLAYLASWRGQPIARDRVLESIFGYGLSDEKYNLTNLTNQFNKCTQFLRQDINKVAMELAIPSLTIISPNRDEWHLLIEECRVVDLNEVERLDAIIQRASGEACLNPTIQNACQTLINIYQGDFLESYIEDIVREGGDNWVDSWIRAPYTAYRTKYFNALWYRAEFWRIKGDLSAGSSEAEQTLQRNWYETAARIYRNYAFHVPTNFTSESAMLFDLEIKQRISLAERALRACLDMYAATKNTQEGDTAYLTFARRMESLTQGRWKPRADTVEAWRNVRAQTKLHRFAPQVTPHDLPQEERAFHPDL